MGIQGLLPLLKSIHRPTELKKFSGETLGVDAYGWLHRGATACAIELAEGKPTRKYVNFVMNRVRMAKHFGVTPYMVFDGDYLPSKGLTEDSRNKSREEHKKAGLEFLKAGKPSQAHLELQKAIDVTPEMARHLIEELKRADIPYVVAPYEADAQLVYLERQGHISGIISEDSDLLVFGAKRLLTKLDQHGQCVEINRCDFCSCREVSLTGWTDAEFRQMAIFSGCDYLDSVQNLGLKTAHRMIRKHKTPDRVLRMLQFDGKFRVPAEYPTLFRQAEQTFLYQWVFCPKANGLVHLTSLPSDINVDDLPFIGSFVEPEVARKVANGDFNPMTKQEIIIDTLPSPRKRTASVASGSAAPSRTMQKPPTKPIDSYFKGHRRIPLGEMEPNCFTVDPDRVSTMTENGERPIVFPLPRPYIDDVDSRSGTSRHYINQSGNSARTLRRRTEPVSNLLSNGGHSLASSSRRQTTGPDNRLFNATHVAATSVTRSPKKARLCDEAKPGFSPGKEKSKFFSQSGATASPATKGDGYLMSDDSIEEALNDLSDVDGWAAVGRGHKTISVYDGEVSQTTTTEEGIPKDDEQSEADIFTDEAAVVHNTVIPDTPPRNSVSRFSFAPNPSMNGSQKAMQTSRRLSTTTSRRSSGITMTPGSSVNTSMMSSTPTSSLGQHSTTKSTPATTPRLTPLQRLGAYALNRNKQPPTPTFVAPRPPKRSSLGHMSLESMPINPAFVPLPPVDLDEVEALHEPVGSEDLLVPDSEGEEAGEGIENMVHGKTKKKQMDLARFLFA
ncbi:Uu.00g142470.m01.CDS01 [Anthostomella pinea]|uniref:Uu.00g142470.m01.CDS01 n=1 Tax=Anthostomella pinea TaxID=933095 RepID=A0AAI8VQF8_9PEZI|nr:Uu.00g142470.m01.CDS01 [Anthostomella pinea]